MSHRWVHAFCLGALLCACSERTLQLTAAPAASGPDGKDAAAPQSDGGSDAGGEVPLAFDDAGVPVCGNGPCACANDKDDDGDGLHDGFDPECTAPFDDDESTFATGGHGENQNGKFRDCFFDGNSGFDEGCRCANEPRGTNASCETWQATDACIDACLPRLPNGCDCFGCCEVHSPAGVLSVHLSDGCAMDRIDDAAACPRCTPNPSCFNPCGPCELCAGRTPTMLPASCANGQNQCDDGAPVCSAAGGCGAGEYCFQGCCQLFVP
ncbi:MAG: hypothetical protein RL385_976 [Pseudomonadota bacterium]|jgi:hypothetical protein